MRLRCRPRQNAACQAPHYSRSDEGIRFRRRSCNRNNWQKLFPERRIKRWREWFQRYGWATIISSRFLPGTRIPAFAGAGLVGGSVRLFLLWIAIAGCLWTPMIVVLAAYFGDAITQPVQRVFGESILVMVVALFVLFYVVNQLVLLVTREGRCRLHARISRLWRWEFWPAWLFYLPLYS